MTLKRNKKKRCQWRETWQVRVTADSETVDKRSGAVSLLAEKCLLGHQMHHMVEIKLWLGGTMITQHYNYNNQKILLSVS